MAEPIQKVSFLKVKMTRRGATAHHVKAICTVAMGAVIARLAKSTSAHALGDGGGHDGGGHYGGGHDGGGHDGGHHGGECFLRGTRIRTVDGERRIECLAIGDLLPTVFGGTRPIQWITRFCRHRSDPGKPWKTHAQPIRIMRSALAAGVPHTDLYVTRGHALLIDGVLVTAGSLVNGTTIAPYPANEHNELELFQIKLECHDVIYAEGAPCETLLRVAATANNPAEYSQTDGPRQKPEAHCAPVFGNGARSEIKWRVRSMMSPWLGSQQIDIIRDRLEQRAMTLMAG